MRRKAILNGTLQGAVTQEREMLGGRRCARGQQRTAGACDKQRILWRRQGTHQLRGDNTLAVGRRFQGLVAEMADRAVRVRRGTFVVVQGFACRRCEQQQRQQRCGANQIADCLTHAQKRHRRQPNMI
jgi:hypothetical protein